MAPVIYYKIIMMLLVVCLILNNTYATDPERDVTYAMDTEADIPSAIDTEYKDPVIECLENIAKFFNLTYAVNGDRGDMTREKCFEKGLYTLKNDYEKVIKNYYGSEYYHFFNFRSILEKMNSKSQFCANESEAYYLQYPSERPSETPLSTDLTLQPGTSSSYYYSLNTTEIEQNCLGDLIDVPENKEEAFYYVFYTIDSTFFTNKENNTYGPKYMDHVFKTVEFKDELFHPERYCREYPITALSDEDTIVPVTYSPKYNLEWLNSEFDKHK